MFSRIVSLYWFENVVIGVFNVLKMLTAGGDMLEGKNVANPNENPEMPAYLRKPVDSGAMSHGIKVFLIPFFSVHCSLFCLVHGIFVFTLLGGEDGGMMEGGPFSGIGSAAGRVFDSGGKWFILAIIGSHLFSFLFNYIGKGEFRRISAPALMMSLYGRIVVLHVAIILGAFVIMALGGPVFLLLLLIAGKIALDVKLHNRSHAKLAAADKP